MTPYDLIDIEVWLHHESHAGNENAGAYLVSTDHKHKTWVPKVACQLELTNGNRGTLTLTENLAIERGLV